MLLKSKSAKIGIPPKNNKKHRFSTVEVVQYIGGITSVLWGIVSVLWRLLSTLGDSFSTVEGIQYIGGLHQYMQGDNISTVGNTISTVGVFSTMGNTFSTVGDTFSTMGDNISTVEVAQYSGDKDLKYYEFSNNLEIVSESLFRFEIRSTTSQASIVDHG